MCFFDDFVKLKDYPNYGVSRDGRVYSYKSNKELIPSLKYHGYLQVQVYLPMDKRPKWRAIHRLVAETFIPNPHGLPQVNHKDENKQNNRVENLEWCTQKYNIEYSKGQGVIRINPISGSIVEYASIAEAARQNNMMRSQIIHSYQEE